MKGSCYLVIQPTRRALTAPVTGFRIVGMTQGLPRLGPGQVTVRVTIDADAAAFDPRQVTIRVLPEHVEMAMDAVPVSDGS